MIAYVDDMVLLMSWMFRPIISEVYNDNLGWRVDIRKFNWNNSDALHHQEKDQVVTSTDIRAAINLLNSSVTFPKFVG